MQLVYIEKNKEIKFEVSRKTIISSKLKFEFLNIWKNLIQDKKADARMDAYNKLVNIKDSITKENGEQIEVGDIDSSSTAKILNFNKAISEFDAESEIHNTLVLIDAFKVIIDKKQLTTKQQELVNLPSDSDFWQEQDLNLIKAEVTGFCTIIAI